MAVSFNVKDTSGQVTGSPSSVSTPSMTISAGSNIAGFACVYGDNGMTVSSVNWNTSEAMTQIDTVSIAGIGAIFVYKIVNPTTGAHVATANVGSTTEAGISFLVYNGVDQTNPVSGTPGHANGSSTDATHTITLGDANAWLAGFCLSQRSLTASTGIATLRDAIFSQCINSDSNAANGSTTGTGHMTLSSSNVWEIILWGINPVQTSTNHFLSLLGVGS